MADEEERIKAEKLAAAKKRVAQLQKQKKKAGKKAATTEAPKEADAPKEAAAPTEEGPAEAPAEVKQDEPESTEKEAQKEEEQQAEPETESKPEPEVEPTAEPEKRPESPVEPMPEAPTSPSPGPDAEPQTPDVKLDTPRAGHTRQPSLSIQSKMRSSSFRKGSVSQGSASTSPSNALKSPSVPSLPPLTGNGDSVHEVYRKQSMRIEELEKENKRLEKQLEESTSRWRKTEEQLEDLREASVDAAELKDKLEKAELKAAEIDELKAEIASLQRQNSHLQNRSHRNNASISVPAPAESPPADLVQQLESKSATIEAMELEISNLRAQLSEQSSSSSAHEAQVAALEERLSQSESALEKSQRELTDTKNALTRASEKAVKEGVDKTSTETLIKNLQREIEELKQERSEAEKKIDTLDKKLQAMGNLHKESETRHQARLRESEKTEKEAAVLRKRLASVENENLRLKEDLERLRKRESGGTDDDALDELEDEERSRLERRIRDLEGEVFDLRRGVWKERRDELSTTDQGGYTAPDTNPAANAFDDVDLVGGSSADHARRRSMAQQHSSFSTVLSSGLAAFTGGYGNRSRASSTQQHPPAARGSLELLSEENFEDEFDEAEFARAQAEEEARKRVEWVREIKGKLKDWKGWRLDLVDSRAGAEGAGVGMGEIFEI
ncbi:hypothetical protein ALT_4699 [Aspergillus lentulus]|uniref:M protein repeat protein n=1 Tax=Aspergillus lentulus TaxID=293939 RepID=A0AAN4PJM9_ASPLE|nr:uncharacterized protein IFM58399_02385 [Aspergillus lentulus]GAQ07378.1 hypothetical protein ALT_4699 [Aspergillus lentulus]GFF29818.1 hypothetical protein IFM58399_02385 [Aspergillus lentulus]GFF59115.1 hypothetical protein IFM62136_04054 [Aspergillus lentulus]GFF64023.1 hypothetical protein IFM60648_01120 [Aspergillus lentulus]GFF67801.1 hypothetical protein IFM47457_01843 [Aspergillus lentulus]